MSAKPKHTLVIASGGFDPLHFGHVEYLQKARSLGDELVVIVNNDNWLRAKKGKIFMREQERLIIMRELRSVTRVYLSGHEPHKNIKKYDFSICQELLNIAKTQSVHTKLVFAKGGDRTLKNIPEAKTCKKLGIKMVFGLGEKIQSSSKLI